ncbi:DegT/DnrJ/EryC1/StrS family aminotransferase [Aquihabitans sp. G128]|uniref:DegT/DnrJ/EryC1/StrS family aminotransferase n=1 Tax=Aquihabitans sp. G128 TaxID=2849779 RepID=UPI001C242E70|nr:DegT/DnrJ/EryC1/StrS family aminotransferase [Aquihabitans sp. G128]QXC60261.1 DegT/DnrJ/EryC1/StrS family aminotransferase [Aquihabitans sp. G128]
MPTWTFAASASSVVRAGGVPVLLDVDEDTLNLSPAALEAALGEGLDGVVLVHFGGVPVAPEVLDLAAAAGAFVVEDAAHALGATDHRGPISGLGTVGACFSFYASKNLTSGEGGALATHDPELAQFARSHRLHGLSNDAWKRYRIGADPSYDLQEPGLKANLPDILAALGRSQLARFDALQARRRQLVRRYRDQLATLPGLRVVPRELDERSADHLLVVLLPEGVARGPAIAALSEARIGSSVHFRPLHTFSWYAQHAPTGPGGVPVADRLRERALSLPLHAGLTDGDVDRVVAVLAQALA